MMRRQAALLAVALLAAGSLVACSGDPGPDQALNAYASGFKAKKFDSVTFEDNDGKPLASADVVAQIAKLSGDLDPAAATISLVGKPDEKDDRASGKLKVDWQVASGLVWSYETTVFLHKVEKAWHVVFAPTAVHPQLKEDRGFKATLLTAERGPILDGAGQPIVQARPVVTVGIEPQRVKNQASLIAALDAAFKSVSVAVDLAGLPAQLASANPDAFVDVVTLRRETYDQIRSRIRDLDGTVFREGTLQLAPTRTFARALLGTVGDVTKEQMDKNPGRYIIGQQVGQSGLQAEYDDLLDGVPGVQIGITQPRSDTGTGQADIVVFKSDPKNGAALKTTLAQNVQNAADAALSGRTQNAAVVAIKISDGSVLAVANGPDGGPYNLAFTASVPPGSTFKVVTALGLLDNGSVNLDTPVDCPKQYTVEGRTFQNASGFELGTVPFRVDLAKSCNTAFASLAPKLGADGLRKAGTSVGVGTTWNFGTDVFTGSVPANASAVEAAAAAFGQGQTLVSPVAMCGAIAAIARGAWLQPKIFSAIPEGAPQPKAGTSGAAPADGTKLKAESVSALATGLREAVTTGTAGALSDVPGAPVQAKTGTAEFSNNPAETHSWVVGWQGDIAFAVFVENGGGSNDTAVPIAEAFLRGL